MNELLLMKYKTQNQSQSHRNFSKTQVSF